MSQPTQRNSGPPPGPPRDFEAPPPRSGHAISVLIGAPLELSGATEERPRSGSTAPMGASVDPLAPELEGLSDRYEIVRRIGAGGMGVVYEARDRGLDRPVALKVLRSHGAISDDQIERLEREARTAARLGHPNIVAVTDFGRVQGRGAFLVMELLQGESLGARLARKQKLPASEVTDVSLQVLDALAAAHRAGVVHRDLKPENIHLVPLANGSRLAKLLDFGIVKLRESPASKQLTERGAIIGTPLYMAPEQVEGREVDARTDIYAMGATMYQMLSGAMPYDAKTPAAIVGAILDGPPVPLSIRAPELPQKLLSIVDRAMARDPGARFPDAGAMRDALIATDVRLGVTMMNGGMVAPPPPAPVHAPDAAKTRAVRPAPANASGAVTVGVLPRQRMAPTQPSVASAVITSGTKAIASSSLDARLVAVIALIAIGLVGAALFVWARTSGMMDADATLPPPTTPVATAPVVTPTPPPTAPVIETPPVTAEATQPEAPPTETGPTETETPPTETSIATPPASEDPETPRVRRPRPPPATTMDTTTMEGSAERPPPSHRVDEFINPFGDP